MTVYDDFAHHPTAIAATIAACAAPPAGASWRCSNPVRTPCAWACIATASARPWPADYAAILVPPDLNWDIARAFAPWPTIRLFDDITALVAAVAAEARAGDRILAMSNGAFAGVHERLLARLAGSA